MLDYQPFPTLLVVKVHLIVNCILAALMVVVVSLRIWSRIYLKAGLGLDDAFIIFAMPMGIGMLVISGLWSQLGIGYNLAEVIINLGLILRLLFAYQLMYCIVIAAAKFSVLCFYLRIFVQPKIRLVTKICMGIVGAGTLGNLLQPFLMCRPFTAIYDPTVTSTCGDELASLVAMGLPIYTLWGLKMRLAKKLGLMAIFLVGLFHWHTLLSRTTIVGIIRLANLTTVELEKNLPGTMVYADFLTTLEPNLGILCVSLPMLGGLFRRWFNRGAESNQMSYGSSNRTDGKGRTRQKFKKMDESILMETMVDSGHRDTGSETELAPSVGSGSGITAVGRTGRSGNTSSSPRV
ncbi:hypothetical protein B0J14DRAFT_569727 [Halenospora varia]|nr:hypothetical protein B0J14DRAFT_569727 [Halenospora varia]